MISDQQNAFSTLGGSLFSKILLLAILIPVTACTTAPRSSNTEPVEILDTPSPGEAEVAPRAALASASDSKISAPSDTEKAELDDQNIWRELIADESFAAYFDHPKVVRYTKHYRAQDQYFHRLHSRSRWYLPFILNQIKQRQLPSELALLPYVESAYNPHAVSPSGAEGLWQIMPATGRHLGLRNNEWLDERRGLASSTDAALRYLQYLYQRFGNDWLLALAAYNCGEGRVERAIIHNVAKQKPIDYWSLRLPRETTRYVPRLIALARILSESHGDPSVLPNTRDMVDIKLIELPRQLNLEQISDQVDIDSIFTLNPGLKKWSTPPQESYRLVVPRHRATDIGTALSALAPQQWIPTDTYTVRPGDTLGGIATRHRLSIQQLLAFNEHPKGKAQGTIFPKQVLRIPNTDQRPSPGYRWAYSYYRTQSGDSLWKIAKRHQLSVTQLARWNGLSKKAVLPIGRVLKIKATTATETAHAQNKRNIYQVRIGDSLSEIAQRFSIALDDIIRWNQISNASRIKPGQTLVLSPRS